MTGRERDLMLHAIGGKAHMVPWRNRFCADCDGEDFRVWAGLAAAGLAIGQPYGLAPGMWVFYVTRKGLQALCDAETREKGMAQP